VNGGAVVVVDKHFALHRLDFFHRPSLARAAAVCVCNAALECVSACVPVFERGVSNNLSSNEGVLGESAQEPKRERRASE